MVKEIAKALFNDPSESRLELKPVTSAQRIPALQEGQVDIIAATMTINDERKQQIDFSDVYYLAGQSLLVKKDSPITKVQGPGQGGQDGLLGAGLHQRAEPDQVRPQRPEGALRWLRGVRHRPPAGPCRRRDHGRHHPGRLRHPGPQPQAHRGQFTQEPYGMGSPSPAPASSSSPTGRCAP